MVQVVKKRIEQTQKKKSVVSETGIKENKVHPTGTWVDDDRC